jgi:PTH1 family peptidyl-tRNA hydrolase
MNHSGEVLAELLDETPVPLDSILVVVDDFALPLGRLRLRGQGSHGGHNGLRDIEFLLASAAYPRLRVGIGSPDGSPPADVLSFVLGPFLKEECNRAEESIELAASAVLDWIQSGLDYCQNYYNRLPAPAAEGQTEEESP